MKKFDLLIRRLPVLIGVLLVMAIGAGLYHLRDLFQKPVQTKKMVQQVTIIQPPPPPPPPPEQKPPEPEVKEEKIEAPEPEPEPEAKQEEAEASPGEELGVDAEGGAGSDAFGLVGKKGGRGLVGGGGNAVIWYGGRLSKEIEKQMERLLTERGAAPASYSVLLNVWVGNDGRVSRAELASSSGKPEVDGEIRSALGRMSVFMDRPPPETMPQPVKIRFTSRI